jgi:hypothetical protein
MKAKVKSNAHDNKEKGIKMKRLIPIIIGTLALVGCGSKTVYVTSTEVPNSPETTEKVVKTTDAPIATPAPEPAYTTEDEFIYDIETSYGKYISVSDEQMIDTGYATCNALQSGSTGYDVLNSIISSANGDADIEEFLTSVVASAVINFCPEQEYKFNN